jgi:hypothetical protein
LFAGQSVDDFCFFVYSDKKIADNSTVGLALAFRNKRK